MNSIKKALRIKRQFVNVIPKSSEAKYIFNSLMFSLHGMEILEENETEYFLMSINKKYCFWVNKTGDDDWDLVK